MDYYYRNKRRSVLQPFCIQMDAQEDGVPDMYDQHQQDSETNGSEYSTENSREEIVEPFSFACELAHGSRQVRVSGFSSIPELYQRIAERFNISTENILYCTLDTNNIDMEKLLGNQIALNHTIYVHVKGQVKEVRFTKSREKLGLTVTDNRAGGVFIKKISPDGLLGQDVDRGGNWISAGDMIECINGRSFRLCRHVDVVNYLKELPVGKEVLLRLISPEKSPLPGISGRYLRRGNIGRQTIRITANGAKIMDELNQDQTKILKRIANILGDYLGISDAVLSQEIFDIACSSENEENFQNRIKTDVEEFNFPKNILVQLWSACDRTTLSFAVSRNGISPTS